MNVNRLVMIRNGDVLGRFRQFLDSWWEQMDLTAMLAPVVLSDAEDFEPLRKYTSASIHSRSELDKVNPFVPFMSANNVAQIGEYLDENPKGRLAIMLRPCELRTLVEMQKRNRLPIALNDRNEDRVVIIGVDCPGTFPVNEFEQRVASMGLEKIVQETFSYGLDSSPTPRQMRTACQICSWPAPVGADLTIGSMGVAAKGYLLMIARDEMTDTALRLSQTTDGKATEHQVSLREMAVGTVADQHSHSMAILQAEFDQSIGDFSNLLACLARCTLCADCLDACPLYNGELSSMLGVRGDERRNRPLLSELVGLSRWLVSCSGCGMCQEACENEVALALLISALSHRIRQELNYPAGDPRQQLPWDRPRRITSETTRM